MYVRRIAPLVAAALLACAPAAAAAPKPCRASRGKTVAQNRYVRVYEQPRHDVPSGSTALVGCNRETRTRRVLAERYSETWSERRYELIRLRRRYVAVARTQMDWNIEVEFRRSAIAVFDADGWHARTADAEPVRAVLAVDGGVAWVERRGRHAAVRAMDSHGRRTLDRGAIPPRSLHVGLTIVTWRNAGERRFARLR